MVSSVFFLWFLVINLCFHKFIVVSGRHRELKAPKSIRWVSVCTFWPYLFCTFRRHRELTYYFAVLGRHRELKAPKSIRWVSVWVREKFLERCSMGFGLGKRFPCSLDKFLEPRSRRFDREWTLRCDQNISALCAGLSSVRRFNTLQKSKGRCQMLSPRLQMLTPKLLWDGGYGNIFLGTGIYSSAIQNIIYCIYSKGGARDSNGEPWNVEGRYRANIC